MFTFIVKNYFVLKYLTFAVASYIILWILISVKLIDQNNWNVIHIIFLIPIWIFPLILLIWFLEKIKPKSHS